MSVLDRTPKWAFVAVIMAGLLLLLLIFNHAAHSGRTEGVGHLLLNHFSDIDCEFDALSLLTDNEKSINTDRFFYELLLLEVAAEVEVDNGRQS